MNRKCLVLTVVALFAVMVNPAGAQTPAVKKKVNLNAANIKKATEILNNNKQFFSNPENVKTFTRLIENMDKQKIKETKQAAVNTKKMADEKAVKVLKKSADSAYEGKAGSK